MKIKKLVLFFIMGLSIFMVGCESKQTEEESKKVVTDDIVKTALVNHISAIESIDKTVELYKKGSFNKNDYTNEEYIHIALNQMVNTHQDTYLTANEKKKLKAANINATSYINANDVVGVVNDLIGPKTVDKVQTVNGCPSYSYNAATNRYYVNNECEKKERIISYIHEIVYEGNEYYAVVYTGYVFNNTLYNSVNKDTEIDKLDNEGSYSIDKDNKDKFSKYTYKFIKNSDGDYIFENVEK